MKKLVLSLAVIASMSLFACGSSDKQAEAVDTVAVEEAVIEEVDTVVVADSVAVDTVVEAAAAVVAE